MRHYKKGRKLGTNSSHTKAMRRSLVQALFTNDRIKTVEARAKEIRPDVDRIITWAKKGDLHSRRLAIAWLQDKELVREVFTKVEQGMFQDRQGGYTRIMKLGYRKGDNAPMVIMELCSEPVRKAVAESDKSDSKRKILPNLGKKAEETAPVAEDEATAETSETTEELAEEVAETAGELSETAKEAAEEVAGEPSEMAEEAAEEPAGEVTEESAEKQPAGQAADTAVPQEEKAE